MRPHALILGALAAPALANFHGHTVTASWYYPDFGTPLSFTEFVVSDAVERPSPTTHSIDLAADTILFTFHQGTTWLEAGFNGWHFTDTHGALPDVAAFELEAITGSHTAADRIDTDFNADAVWINFSGFIPDSGATLLFRVTFVPAPAGLLALAPLALTATRRQRPR